MDPEYYESRKLYEAAGDEAAKKGLRGKARELYAKAEDDYRIRKLTNRAASVREKMKALAAEDIDSLVDSGLNRDDGIDGLLSEKASYDEYDDDIDRVLNSPSIPVKADEPAALIAPVEVDTKPYIETLKAFGYTDDQLKPIEAIGKIDVDKSGYSGKVAEVLSDAYMGNGMIFSTPMQKSLVSKSAFSFMGQLADEVFRNCSDYIDTFSRDAPVYGAFEIYPGSEIKIAGKLFTTAKTKEKLETTKKRIESLTIDEFVNKDYVKSLIDDVKGLRAIVGDIRSVRQFNNSFATSVDSFSYRSDGREYYCFADRVPFSVSFGGSLKLKGVNEINGESKEEVLEEFLSRGMVVYDEKKKSEMLLDEERTTFIKLGYHPDDVERIMGMKGKPEHLVAYAREWKKIKDSLSDDWKKVAENRISELDVDKKSRLISVYAKGRRGELVEQILSRY